MTMARIERMNLSSKFTQLTEDSRFLGETNDCGVKAVALACDVPYAEAYVKLKRLGRRDRKGTPWAMIRRAIEEFGFEIKTWTTWEQRQLIDTYPGVHKNLHQITTHHPRRFPKAWAPLKEKRLLLGVHKHVAAFRDGEVIDWTVNSAKRVWMILEVTKK